MGVVKKYGILRLGLVQAGESGFSKFLDQEEESLQTEKRKVPKLTKERIELKKDCRKWILNCFFFFGLVEH